MFYGQTASRVGPPPVHVEVAAVLDLAEVALQRCKATIEVTRRPARHWVFNFSNNLFIFYFSRQYDTFEG